jgi:hypothetical protein
MRVTMMRLPRGGGRIRVVPNPRRYKRLTVALINGDARIGGHRRPNTDWDYRPGATISARLSSDFKPPRITHRSPGNRRRGVSRFVRVKVHFSERMTNLRRKTVVLRTGGGRRVKARLTIKRHRRVTIRPRLALRPHRRYVVTLSGSIRDRGANRLPARARRWSFRTRG